MFTRLRLVNKMHGLWDREIVKIREDSSLRERRFTLV
jgi:hypothetical protein